jgi:hypothetical protein
MKKYLNSMLLLLITLITILVISGYNAGHKAQTVENNLVNKIDSVPTLDQTDFSFDDYNKQLDLPDIK